MNRKDSVGNVWSRRGFIGTALSSLGAMWGWRGGAALAAADVKIRDFRLLGRTKLKISDVCFGTYGLTQAEVLLAALDAGVNFVDTGPTYGEAEVVVGQALSRRKRENVILATRWYSNKPDTPAVSLLKQLDKSLARLQTEYVDVIFLGGAESVDQLENPALHEAFAAAKAAGKVRYMGVATHAKQLIAIVGRAVESGKFDVIMPSYNFMQSPGLEKEIAAAARKSVAVVAMKTLGGARAAKVQGFGGSRSEQVRAAISWALRDAAVSSVVITMKTFDDVKDGVGASGAKHGARDAEILRRYAQACSADYCRPGCDICTRGYNGPVRVQDVFRYQMYAEKYGLEGLARQAYAALPAHEQAGNEALFAGLGECPFGVDVKKKLAMADKRLWFA